MSKLPQHTINAILFTIVVHLFAVIIGLLLNIRTKLNHYEEPIIIEPEMLAEDDEVEDETAENDLGDIDIDEYIQQLRNAGTNYQSDESSLRDNQEMSREDIRKSYEEQILREKYGDDYEEMMNANPEDYLPEDFSPGDYSPEPESGDQQVSHNGPALVYAELDDATRKTRYLHIPVFTCEGSGIVVIGITIENNGKVKRTQVLQSDVNKDADCLIEAATRAAEMSKFSIITNNTVQQGKIIYQFLPQ